jgi:hypothetical protein
LVTYSLIALTGATMAGDVLRGGRKLTFGNDRCWRKADIRGLGIRCASG